MEPTLIGYFPKRPSGPPDRLKAEGLLEIASVSECITAGPLDWVEQWLHNDMGYFDQPVIAWKVVPEESRSEYAMYAYALFPIQFINGAEVAFCIPEMTVQPIDDSFECLGFDFVNRSAGSYFECSPLSCNSLAETVQVNPFCLVDAFETASNLAKTAEAEGCEPGPYFVVQVWRQRALAS